MLDLEDFSSVAAPKESEAREEHSKEQAEESCDKKLKALEKERFEAIGEEREKAYKEGYENAREELEREYREKLQNELEQLSKKQEQELSELKSQCAEVNREIGKKFEKQTVWLNDIVLDGITDILEFLYINTNNKESIARLIEKLIAEFQQAPVVEVHANREMCDVVRMVLPDVKMVEDDEVQGKDFVIDFSDFQLENTIKEKIDVVKDEIKREIKKFTEV